MTDWPPWGGPPFTRPPYFVHGGLFVACQKVSVSLNGAQYLNAPRVVGRHADTSNIDSAMCASDV
jgi:hypothetical protein